MSTSQPHHTADGESADQTTADQTTKTAVGETPARPATRSVAWPAIILSVTVVLFAVPWWTLVFGGAHWPAPAAIAASIAFAAVLVAFPLLMIAGHGRRHLDRAAVAGDTILGVIWTLFAWSILGNVLRIALALAGVGNPARGRLVAAAVIGVAAVLLLWGYAEAMRVPRVKRVDVTLPRLGADLDGLTVVLLTDTHYGPINRARWSGKLVDVVNEVDADILCHTGDIADGSVAQRLGQAAPLGRARAKLARAYVTGNHEYFGEAQGWLDHMRELGWQPLHNRHIVVERGASRLIVAGVDDRTARSSGLAGHAADHAAALAGADPDLPVLLLAHQPRQIVDAAAHGVDLQLSGHTHGGQIWPFHFLVRTDQPALAGLSRHGERTWLYTSRGSGFWGPPFRVFAPSEITVLTLRANAARPPA